MVLVSRFAIVFLVILILTACANADMVKLKCVADTNISSYPSEQAFNYGKSAHIRLKGIEMIGLFQFDTAPIQGWTVRRATLYLRYAGSDRKLRTVGISTISAPWSEGTGSGEARAGETCFLRNGGDRWAGPQTDFTDVSFTAGNTIANYADIEMHENDWLSVPVDARLVQAMVAGATYGVAVSDEKGQTMANNDVYSREQSGSEPYLVVEGERLPPTPPTGKGIVSFNADSAHGDFTHAAIDLHVLPPSRAFSYNVSARYGAADFTLGGEVSRAQIPLATPQKLQTFRIVGLPPTCRFKVVITPVAADGSPGIPMELSGSIGNAAKPEPDPLKHVVRRIELSRPPPPGELTVSAYPDTEKANPITGSVLEAVGEKAYSSGAPSADSPRNAIWNGADVSLCGARNEILGFHILVNKGSANTIHDVKIVPPAAWTHTGADFKPYIALYRDWYVNDHGWFPEACIPLTSAFDIPAADNMVPAQQNQSIFVDLMIPANTAPGDYTGAFTVSAPGRPDIKLPIRLTVSSLTLPNKLSFDISLNAYGTFGGLYGLNDNTVEYRSMEREYHRLAFMHRSTLAQLGYSHSGNTTSNYAPSIAGTGKEMRVTDWTAWDRQFAGYLDGTAFSDLPRKAEPISHLYLPFHEAWPVDIRKHYDYKQTVFDYPAMITEHAMKAEPIEQATDDELREGFRAIAAQFAAHFKEQGWTHTMFQFYQNDKYYYKDPKQGGRGTSWWLLDEPNHRDDWLVLAYFDRLFEEGVGKSPGVTLTRREDISRPQWQRDYLDGLVDLMCVSSELFTKGPRMREMQEKFGIKYWNYGAANAVNRPNTDAEAWAVRAWLAGADAIVPWQSIGEDKNFETPDETALILPGTRFGLHGPIASLRLKALRRAQQDVEYLVLLAQKKGWDREQVGAALRDILALKMTAVKANDNDAGSYQFGAHRADDFAEMRRAIGETVTLK